MAQQTCQETSHQTSRRGGLLAVLDLWRRRSCDRQTLLAADERSLRDMGLTRYDALYEAHKRFWHS
jgi:uncharacterized protein YjiS (DUF1127 family)